MKIPAHLKHKPILQVENYDRMDGQYTDLPEGTDAMGLSIGIAQWNRPGHTDLSAKVWRNVEGKWSRQSEELPLHRVIDLATLVCAAKDYSENGNLPSSDDFPVTRAADNIDLSLHTEIMKKELLKNNDGLHKSLLRLAAELKRLGY